MSLRKRVPRSLVRWIYRALFPVPRHLAQRQIPSTAERVEIVRTSLRQNYHIDWRSPDHYSPDGYAADLFDHLTGRLDSDRRMVMPWLDAAKPLAGSTVLEIGCGTGSSTVALAEQGATVVGIDPDTEALQVAKDRCVAYGVEATFHPINATAMRETLTGRFDFIIFFASLEHMTIPERLTALRDASSMLPAGGLLVIVETPNRLWYEDGHTSLLPGFHWLPDELAFAYSRYSPRENFRELYRENGPEQMAHFLRQGRGASYHEFDLAIGQDLTVVSSLSTFHGLRYKPQRNLSERWYARMLRRIHRRIYPTLHPGWCEDTLFIVLKKNLP